MLTWTFLAYFPRGAWGEFYKSWLINKIQQISIFPIQFTNLNVWFCQKNIISPSCADELRIAKQGNDHKCETVCLRPEAHVVHSVCHCGLANVKVRHLAVAIETSVICILVTFCIYLILEVADVYVEEDRPENGSLRYAESDISKPGLFIINLNELSVLHGT